MKKLAELKNELETKLFKKASKEFEWTKKGSTFYIHKNNQLIYQEGDQHVTAVAKLLRIPKEYWLLWAQYVVIYGKTDDVKALPLEKRYDLFKKAFQKVIQPFYNEAPSKKWPKPVECVNCGGKTFSEKFERNDQEGLYFVFICDKCGLGMRNRVDAKEALTEIYTKDDYFSGDNTTKGYFDYHSEAPWRIKKAENYLHDLEKVTGIKPGKAHFLDIGSGFGYFLKVVQDEGYTGIGVELSPEAVEVANKKYKTKTLEGDIVTLYNKGILKDNQFDFLTLWDIIEHFYDVTDEIKIMAKILKPGGFVALRTNNIDSIAFEVFGKYFHSVKDEHTFYYTDKTLTQLFEQDSIKKVKTWTHTHLFLAFMTTKERNEIDKNCRGEDIFYVGQKQ
jgi:2-polyprenyl-3-methyl-5-hydroxy-6-metoxy-1,4-benzoquinol methylase